MKKGQSHPAALTSKKLLSSALIKLMDKKEYEYISITELCEHSQVSRRTFYRNFNKIDDIIIFIAKGIINEFVSEINKHSKESFYDVMISFFSFWKNYSQIILTFNKSNLIHIIFKEYIECLPEIPCICNINKIDLECEDTAYLVAFAAGGLWSMLTYWIICGCKQSPEELSKIIKTQILAIRSE